MAWRGGLTGVRERGTVELGTPGTWEALLSPLEGVMGRSQKTVQVCREGNIYLHEVLDVWFAKEVTPRLQGRAFLVRYADDFVMGFRNEGDARRVMSVLPKRFGKFGLALHPDKTRLLNFQPPRFPDSREVGGSFDFLGFTRLIHSVCCRSVALA